MSKRKNQHVVPHEGGWAVRGAGNEKVTREFPTQQEAIEYGRQIAINQQSELLIHNEQGRIRERNSYGNDPLSLQTVPLSSSPNRFSKSHDAFISHASEDKEDFVRPLAQALKEEGYDIWYDEFALSVGDSLRRTIDKGLAVSRYGIVILSGAFFAKNWPQYELNGLVAKEMEGTKVVLPIWHKVSKDEVMSYSPSLADKVAINSSLSSIPEIVEQLGEVLNRSHS